MFNKKIKIIIGVGLIIVLTLILFFIFRNKNVNTTPINPSPSSNQPIVNNSNQVPVAATSVIPTEENASSSLDNINNVASTAIPEPEKVDQAKYLAELKTNYPEYNSAQLEFYQTTAANGEMLPCRGRQDESECILAVAFITRAYSFCGEIKDNAKQLECFTAILNEKAGAEINKCDLNRNNDLRAQCLINIFAAYKTLPDCLNFKTTANKQVCESAVYSQRAIAEQSGILCSNINNESIKIYCLTNIINRIPVATSSSVINNETLDSDNDGLSDREELNKYFTDPKNPDTDGDGYNDGVEVSGGYNPCGSGSLPSLDELLVTCQKFKK